MSASFPGENLSLARSDSQGPPLSQHVTGLLQGICQLTNCGRCRSNLLYINDLLVSSSDDPAIIFDKSQKLLESAAAICDGRWD